MPRRKLPPVRIDASRAQKMAAVAPASPDGTRLAGAREVSIDQVVPDPGQPRRTMDPERLAELARSLTEHGVLQPLLVREDGYLDDGRTRYRVVAGGRRYAAAQIAGLERLPVVVRDTEGTALRLAQLVENLQRQDLAPLDEARAYKELMDADGLSAEALGARLHISGQQIRDRLLLLSDQVVADAVQREQVPATVASELLRLPDEARHELRGRVEAGETLQRSDVRAARTRAKDAGVVNPKAKGGGRRARSEGQSGFDPAPTPSDQSRFDRTHAFATGVHALADQIQSRDLQAYTDRKQVQDARYDADADPYALGFIAALEALRKAVEA